MRPATASRKPQALKVLVKFSGDFRNSVSELGSKTLQGAPSMESIGKQIQLAKPAPRTISSKSYFRLQHRERPTRSPRTTPSYLVAPTPEVVKEVEEQSPATKKLLVSPKPEMVASTPTSPKKLSERMRVYNVKQLKQLQVPTQDKERKEERAESKIKQNLFSTQRHEHGQVTLTAAPKKKRVSLLPKRNSDLDFAQFPLLPYRLRSAARLSDDANPLNSLKKDATIAYMRKERKFGQGFSMEKYERSYERSSHDGKPSRAPRD